MARRPKTLLLGLVLCVGGAHLTRVEATATAAELDPKGEETAKEATRLYKQGLYPEAAKLYARLSVDYPDMPIFARNMGACFYYLRRPEPALSNLRNYLNHKKDIAPDDKAVVDRWIEEMERLRAENAAAAKASTTAEPPVPAQPTAAPVTPISSVPGPSPVPAPAPAPSTSAWPAPSPSTYGTAYLSLSGTPASPESPVEGHASSGPPPGGERVRSKNQGGEEAPPPGYRRGFLLMPYGGLLILIAGAEHRHAHDSYTDEIFSSLGCRFGLLLGGHLSEDYSLGGEFAFSSWTYKTSFGGSGVQQFDFGATVLRHVRWSWGDFIVGPKLGWSTLHNDWDFSWIGGPLAGAKAGLFAAAASWVSLGVLADLAYFRALDANNVLSSVTVAILF